MTPASELHKIDSLHPCKYCNHKAYRHYVSIAGGESSICLDCVVDKASRDLDNWHNFQPDNLSYIEALAKERNLI